MSILHFQSTANAETTEIVTLSGASIQAFSFMSDAVAELHVRNTGIVQRGVNGLDTQISAATDWIIPNGAAPSDYEGRYTNFSGDALQFATAVENAWSALASNYRMEIRTSGSGFQNESCSFTFEIRKGSSGSAIASGSYTLTANREDF